MKNILTQLFDDKREIKPSRHSASRNLPLVILCGIFLAMGCSTVGKFLPSGGGPGSNSSANQSSANSKIADSNSNQLSDNTKASASPFERVLPLSQPRMLKYANLQYTVTKAVISDRVSNELEMDNSKPAIADITVSVVNTLKDPVRVNSGLWQLKLGDGSVYKQLYNDNLAPRDTQERKISFRVPETAQWTGAQLTLDEQDKEPATMQLDGNQPPPQYPVQLATGGEATPKASDMTYTIQKANMDLDGFSQRAALGKRYLNLTVHVACKEGSAFLPEYFRLLTDDAPSKPENTSDNNALYCPGSQDYVMSYVIPASPAKIELEVGKASIQETAKIPIDLKQ